MGRDENSSCSHALINIFVRRKYNTAVPLLDGILIDKVFWIGDTSLGCLVKNRIVFLVRID